VSKKASRENERSAERQVDSAPLVTVLERLKTAPSEERLAQFVPLSDKLTLSVAEAAQLTGFSPDLLGDAIKAGRLKAKVVKGRRGWTIKRADLEDYVRKL
jgi:excisionase family DNA binding protein